MIDLPLVSVVLPVYNGEKFIDAAVKSVLTQTYKPIELIVINDGSTDLTENTLRPYMDQIIYSYQANQGVASALNHGISLASGKYLARLDADDIAFPERIEKQVAILDKNEEIGVCGTGSEVVDECEKFIFNQTMPITDIEIRWKSLFNSPFLHPSVIIRKQLIDDYRLRYPTDCPHAEDYALWIELLKRTKGFNLSEPLINYRVHKGSISSQQNEEQAYSRLLISKRNIEASLGITISDLDVENLGTLTSFSQREYSKSQNALGKSLILYLDIWNQFKFIHKDKDEIDALERKILTQCFGLMFLYVPIQQKTEVVRKLQQVNSKWALMIPKLIFPYIKKYISFQRASKYR